MKWLLIKLSKYLWSLEKRGRYLKSCNSLTFPPIVMRILKLKFRLCTLSPYALYNCNLNMFLSTAKIIKKMCLCPNIYGPDCYIVILICLVPSGFHLSINFPIGYNKIQNFTEYEFTQHSHFPINLSH